MEIPCHQKVGHIHLHRIVQRADELMYVLIAIAQASSEFGSEKDHTFIDSR
jgi:hypothetical protein